MGETFDARARAEELARNRIFFPELPDSTVVLFAAVLTAAYYDGKRAAFEEAARIVKKPGALTQPKGDKT